MHYDLFVWCVIHPEVTSCNLYNAQNVRKDVSLLKVSYLGEMAKCISYVSGHLAMYLLCLLLTK